MLVAQISGAFLLLAALGCPVGMGLMMWFMGKGMMSGRSGGDAVDAAGDEHSLAELRTEQARLAEKINALEGARENESPPGTAEESPPISAVTESE